MAGLFIYKIIIFFSLGYCMEASYVFQFIFDIKNRDTVYYLKYSYHKYYITLLT